MRVETVRDVGNAVRAGRQVAGLSQADLAEAASVSRPWLSRLENGKPAVDLGLVLRVLAALDLRLSVTPIAGDPTRAAAPSDPAIAVDLDDVLARYRDGR